jgi:VIT1/CCC1 family predicted Fe2+/Mn2+ transporter
VVFHPQDINDLIKIIVLINFDKSGESYKEQLRKRLNKFLGREPLQHVSHKDFYETLDEMVGEGMAKVDGDRIRLSERGKILSQEFKSLLFKQEPILEITAGISDGSIAGLIVIVSAYVANLGRAAALYAAALTLTAVALTGITSLLLGGKTEDLADLITLRRLMEHNLYNIGDEEERERSFLLMENLFEVLKSEISKSNLVSALIFVVTCIFSGIIPVGLDLILPQPLGIAVSLTIVLSVVGIFLVRYRSKKTQINWKFLILETFGLIIASVIVSLLLGAKIA